MKLGNLLAFVLVGCSLAPVAPAGMAAERASLLPPVRAALEFPPAAKSVSMGWLVSELGRLTQQELTLSEVLRGELEKALEPLEITTPVPAEEVYAFVEGLLAQRQVFIAPVKGGTRPVLGVYGGAEARAHFGVRPVVVEAAQMELLAEHPALFCQLLLNFENIDSRQLQTQLRQMMVDNTGFQQVVPCGERGLLLQGAGQTLLGLAMALREVDRASAPRPVPAPSSPEPGPAGPSQPARVDAPH